MGSGRAIRRESVEVEEEFVMDEQQRRRRRNANEYDTELYEPGTAAGSNMPGDEDGIGANVKNVFERIIGAAVTGMKKVINWINGENNEEMMPPENQ